MIKDFLLQETRLYERTISHLRENLVSILNRVLFNEVLTALNTFVVLYVLFVLPGEIFLNKLLFLQRYINPLIAVLLRPFQSFHSEALFLSWTCVDLFIDNSA